MYFNSMETRPMFSFGPREEKPESQLHMSARTGNIESVRTILKEPGVDLTSQYISHDYLSSSFEKLYGIPIL